MGSDRARDQQQILASALVRGRGWGKPNVGGNLKYLEEHRENMQTSHTKYMPTAQTTAPPCCKVFKVKTNTSNTF